MKTCGVLLGAIFERFDTIVEFSAFHDFISFEKKDKNKVKRVENNKIKVTIEVNMRQFYRAFPIRHTLCDELSWSHYRLLMRIENEKAREFRRKCKI